MGFNLYGVVPGLALSFCGSSEAHVKLVAAEMRQLAATVDVDHTKVISREMPLLKHRRISKTLARFAHQLSDRQHFNTGSDGVGFHARVEDDLSCGLDILATLMESTTWRGCALVLDFGGPALQSEFENQIYLCAGGRFIG